MLAPNLGRAFPLSSLNHRVGGDDQPILLLVILSTCAAYLGQVATICDQTMDVAAELAAVEGCTRRLVRAIEAPTSEETLAQRPMHHRQIPLDSATSTFAHVFREILEDLDCLGKAALDFKFVSFAKAILPTEDGIVASLPFERLLELRRAVACKPFRHNDQPLSVTSESVGIGSQRLRLWGLQPCPELAEDTEAVDAARSVKPFLIACFGRVEEHVTQHIPAQPGFTPFEKVQPPQLGTSPIVIKRSLQVLSGAIERDFRDHIIRLQHAPALQTLCCRVLSMDFHFARSLY